jgi:hypothetical protein
MPLVTVRVGASEEQRAGELRGDRISSFPAGDARSRLESDDLVRVEIEGLGATEHRIIR